MSEHNHQAWDGPDYEGCPACMEHDDIRARAVEIVDARHGYTYEFSSSPEAHLREYADEYERLRVGRGFG